jgi:hypothetical protein
VTSFILPKKARQQVPAVIAIIAIIIPAHPTAAHEPQLQQQNAQVMRPAQAPQPATKREATKAKPEDSHPEPDSIVDQITVRHSLGAAAFMSAVYFIVRRARPPAGSPAVPTPAGAVADTQSTAPAPPAPQPAQPHTNEDVEALRRKVEDYLRKFPRQLPQGMRDMPQRAEVFRAAGQFDEAVLCLERLWGYVTRYTHRQ